MLDQQIPDMARLYIALKNKEYMCKIGDFVLKEIKDIKLEDKTNYVIVFDVILTKGKKVQDLELYLDFDHTKVENYQKWSVLKLLPVEIVR